MSRSNRIAGGRFRRLEQMVKRIEENDRQSGVSTQARSLWPRLQIRPPCVRPIWRAKPEVARKLYPAIRRVFERARIVLRDEHGIAMPDNPARWADLKAMGFDAPPTSAMAVIHR